MNFGFKTRSLFIRYLSTQTRLKEIIVPNRIKRGPTDILKALATTINPHEIGPHYRYHDDPFLLPEKPFDRHVNSLSKESGRKAAKYFLDKYPHLFHRDDAEPKIPAFSYGNSYDENTQVTLDDLLGCIERNEVEHSIICYKNLRTASQEIPVEMVQSLLELVCFNNSTEGGSRDNLEAIWFNLDNEKDKNHPDRDKIWNEKGFANELFDSIEPKDSLAYSTYISGLAKYNQKKKAFDTYTMMVKEDIKCSLEAYNAIINCLPTVFTDHNERIEELKQLMISMCINNVRPTLDTFNEALNVLSLSGESDHSNQLALSILSEMKILNIEPSLATYLFIMTILTKDKFNRKDMQKAELFLHEVLDILSEKNLKIRHPKDVLFFGSMMEMTGKIFKNLELSYRLNDVLFYGKNIDIISSNHDLAHYFHWLFLNMLNYENYETTMEMYNRLVPNIYIPERYILEKIIKSTEAEGALHNIPQLWIDIVAFGNTNDYKLLSALISSISSTMNCDEKLRSQICSVAWEIVNVEKYLTQSFKSGFRFDEKWTAKDLGTCLGIFLNHNDVDKANYVLEKMMKEQFEIIGFPSLDVLQNYIVKALEDGRIEDARTCIKYVDDGGYDIISHIEANSEDISQPIMDQLKNIEPNLASP